MPSSTPLRRVISRALRAASRAAAASTILTVMVRASTGCSSRNSRNFSATTSSTTGRTSEETSFSLVCDENLGSGTFTDSTQARPSRMDVVVVVDVAEDLFRGEVVHLGAAPLGLARQLERRYRCAVLEFDLVHLAVAPDGEPEPLGQRVHHGHADAVQAAGNLVGV